MRMYYPNFYKLKSRGFSELSNSLLYISYVICDICAFFCKPNQLYSAFFFKSYKSKLFQSLQDFYCMAVCAVNFFSKYRAVPYSCQLSKGNHHQGWLSSEKDIKIVFHLMCLIVYYLIYISDYICGAFKCFVV